MPGPKPSPATVFSRVFHEIDRLYAMSTTNEQRTIVNKLIAGLHSIEPKWSVRSGKALVPNEIYMHGTNNKIDRGRTEVVYNTGRAAFNEGIEDNPFPDGDARRKIWQAGRDARELEDYREHLPAVPAHDEASEATS